jgi:hypothetical protein
MSKLVNVNNIPQLIDLNEDLVNFKLDFKVFSDNKSVFKAIVASQQKLDSGESLDFKTVDNGTISGSIISDKGVKQNYYLVLKADTPTKCTVELNLKEIPLNPDIIKEKYINKLPIEKEKNNQSINFKEFLNTKTIICTLVILGVIIFYYVFYLRKSGTTTIDTPTQQLELPTLTYNLLPKISDNTPVISSDRLNVDVGDLNIFDNVKENLLVKLNNVQLY